MSPFGFVYGQIYNKKIFCQVFLDKFFVNLLNSQKKHKKAILKIFLLDPAIFCAII